jgi:prepilin-type N-terminal cleavage/methylation domain-containing protein
MTLVPTLRVETHPSRRSASSGPHAERRNQRVRDAKKPCIHSSVGTIAMKNAMRNRQRAFTLVELLVVITIIGILIALMMPAVMSARESARRMTCLSNLFRIGAALNSYQSAHEMLPPGTIDKEGPVHSTPQGYKMSWTVHLLPYLDEGNVYQHIDLSAGACDPKNAAVRAVKLPVFTCPSADPELAGQPSVSNYAGCQNDVEAPINIDNRGVLFLNSHISRDDVTDGISHTIYVGEKLADTTDFGWMSGTRATLRNTGSPPGWGPPDPRKPDPAAKNDLFVGGFSSEHPQVCNYLFGDGRTDSLSDSIDMKVFQQLGNRADGKLLKRDPTVD